MPAACTLNPPQSQRGRGLKPVPPAAFIAASATRGSGVLRKISSDGSPPYQSTAVPAGTSTTMESRNIPPREEPTTIRLSMPCDTGFTFQVHQAASSARQKLRTARTTTTIASSPQPHVRPAQMRWIFPDNNEGVGMLLTIVAACGTSSKAERPCSPHNRKRSYATAFIDGLRRATHVVFVWARVESSRRTRAWLGESLLRSSLAPQAWRKARRQE